MTDTIVTRHFIKSEISNLQAKLNDRRYSKASKERFLSEIRGLNAQLRALA